MMDHESSLNWPTPRQGPEIPYKNETAPSNPVLRGRILAVVATLLTSSSWLQSILWWANGFGKLKYMTQLYSYEPRYSPTVIPRSSEEAITTTDTFESKERQVDMRHWSVSDYHRAFRSGALTPSDVAEYLLPLIDRKTKEPSKFSVAFVEVNPELVRAAAQASTERWQAGRPRGPLDGVPVAVKDEIDLAGYSRMLGSRVDFTNPLGQTGWCVRLWENAGAVVIGKTNMHEVGIDTTGNNPNCGTPFNPHNIKYYTGGSSSGSAMAVSVGICPIALGADGGGSIRLPSSFCGLFGLKPSHGRVSGRPTDGLAPSVGVYGPIASDLESLVVAYRVMAEPDPGTTDSRLFSGSVGRAGTPARKSIGIYRDWIQRSDPEVRQMFDRAVSLYLTYGYELVEIEIPFIPAGQKAHALTILNEVRAGLTDSQLKQLTHPSQILLTVTGNNALAQDFIAAQRLRGLMMEHMAWLWQQYPDMLLLTPTTPCAGWRIKDPSDVSSGFGVIDSDMSLRSMEYVYLANWTGCPALSRPMGYTEEGVPVGIMAMAAWGAEEHLFAWGRDGEDLIEGGCVRRPQDERNWVDVLSYATRTRS